MRDASINSFLQVEINDSENDIVVRNCQFPFENAAFERSSLLEQTNANDGGNENSFYCSLPEKSNVDGQLRSNVGNRNRSTLEAIQCPENENEGKIVRNPQRFVKSNVEARMRSTATTLKAMQRPSHHVNKNGSGNERDPKRLKKSNLEVQLLSTAGTSKAEQRPSHSGNQNGSRIVRSSQRLEKSNVEVQMRSTAATLKDVQSLSHHVNKKRSEIVRNPHQLKKSNVDVRLRSTAGTSKAVQRPSNSTGYRNNDDISPSPFCADSEKNKSCEQQTVKKKLAKTFECFDCKVEFSRMNSLRRHRTRIHSESVVTCDHCEKQFKHSENLKQHRMTHFTRLSSAKKGKKKMKKSKITCDPCKILFTKMSSLKRHIETFHK